MSDGGAPGPGWWQASDGNWYPPSEEPPAPGWWQASDGNWYPPESHPDQRSDGDRGPAAPRAPIPPDAGPRRSAPPSTVPPRPPSPADYAIETAPGPGSSGGRGRLIAITAAGIIVLAVSVAVFAAARQVADTVDEAADGGDAAVTTPTADESTDESAPTSEGRPPPTTGAEPTPATGSAAETGASSGSLGSGAPVGTRDAPLGFDALVPIVWNTLGDADGSVWNIRVSAPRDITRDVLDHNQFNDAPPDGVAFAGFDVEMTLVTASKEPLSQGFNFNWEILGGATSAAYDSTTIPDLLGCGVQPDEFGRRAEVFVGGTTSGTVCIPIPAEDLGHPESRVAMSFPDERIVFAAGGATPDPAEVTGSTGVAGSSEFDYGTTAAVTFDAFGDADESIWNVTIGAPRDVTESVVAASEFNDPPPDGVRFVGFDAEMTLASATTVPLSPGFNFDWEVLGGATSAVYARTTLVDFTGCGAGAASFNDFAEVFVGGTLTGVVCIPVPIEDLEHPDTVLAMNFSGDRVVFRPDGPTGTPAPIDSVDGASTIGDGLALGQPVDVRWDVLGDADDSVWSTTVDDWRDLTADVLAENPFNDAPPDGIVFAGFEVELQLLSADKEPLSTGFNLKWEVLGGASGRVFAEGALPDVFGCGVTPNEFDRFAEVFAGGSLTGTVCIPIAAEDLDHPDTRIAINFDGDRVTFDPFG